MTLIQRIRLALRVLTRQEGGLMRHAESELGPDMDIEVRELLHVFALQGHSGFSAAITDERRRDELPLPLDLKPGDLVPVLGELFRVQRVEQGSQAA